MRVRDFKAYFNDNPRGAQRRNNAGNTENAGFHIEKRVVPGMFVFSKLQSKLFIHLPEKKFELNLDQLTEQVRHVVNKSVVNTLGLAVEPDSSAEWIRQETNNYLSVRCNQIIDLICTGRQQKLPADSKPEIYKIVSNTVQEYTETALNPNSANSSTRHILMNNKMLTKLLDKCCAAYPDKKHEIRAEITERCVREVASHILNIPERMLEHLEAHVKTETINRLNLSNRHCRQQITVEVYTEKAPLQMQANPCQMITGMPTVKIA